MYFGQESEEHVFSMKTRCLEVKNDDFWENMLRKENNVTIIFLITVLIDSAWFCVEKLKIHIVLRQKKRELKTIQKQIQEIHQTSPY